MYLRDLIFTVIDFESTGTVKKFATEPWQIGLVQMKNGAFINSFESLLYVGDRPFHPQAPGLHHQKRQALQKAPQLNALWPTLKPWITEIPLVAHNIGTERKFLTRAAPMHSLGPWIDTLKLVRLVYPQFISHSLEHVTHELNLNVSAYCPNRTPHDALYDAYACALLLQHILNLPEWKDLTLESYALL